VLMCVSLGRTGIVYAIGMHCPEVVDVQTAEPRQALRSRFAGSGSSNHVVTAHPLQREPACRAG
jgi:hypothetical protein